MLFGGEELFGQEQHEVFEQQCLERFARRSVERLGEIDAAHLGTECPGKPANFEAAP